jgi:serine/threonine protein kinase
MNWLYKDKEVSIEDIAEDAVGFVYKIIHTPTGKYYIGKKLLESVRNVKIGKRELERIKSERKELKLRGSVPKKKKVRKISDWETYYSSNEWINEEVKSGKGDEFSREILQFCNSKKSLSYYEVEWMFRYDVLRDENSLNGNISGKWYRKDLV